eukprot:572494-Hanusia_phi.AAC.1
MNLNLLIIVVRDDPITVGPPEWPLTDPMIAGKDPAGGRPAPGTEDRRTVTRRTRSEYAGLTRQELISDGRGGTRRKGFHSELDEGRDRTVVADDTVTAAPGLLDNCAL